MKNGTEYIKNIINGITEEDYGNAKTLLSLDTGGRLKIDGFDSIADYTSSFIAVLSGGRQITIYGDNLVITGCDKSIIHLQGKISRIELE
ncbi:MAG: hypothetical protein IJ410_02915 [Oscillospiraceae bacterium]|nr:hypothetical protein [Oscillospiraceae bacterium]